MFKRNLLIGSLVAGAFVLPSLANAGVVAGVCSNCHTMHASQNGATLAGGPQADLLKGSGCTGCHANGDNNTSAAGLPTVGGGINAPQVDFNAASKTNSAGYFNTAGADENQHNVRDTGYDTGADVSFADAAAVVPGSTALYSAFTLTCTSCHDAPGHHTSTGGYRMLGTAAGTGVALHNYSPGTGGAAVGDRSTVQYNAAVMNQVCADCHTSFHGIGVANTGTGAGAWIRHPTNVDMDVAFPSQSAAFAASDEVVVGIGNEVMCLSCHVSHGGAYADLLAFNYTLEVAGAGVSTGCENCHSYNAGGM